MKSVFGLEQNLAAALSYVFVFFSGFIVLILERENKFVRFNALQSIFWFLLLMIFSWVITLLTGIPFLGWFLGIILTPVRFAITIASIVSWIVLVYKSLQNEVFKLPIIGEVAWNFTNKES